MDLIVNKGMSASKVARDLGVHLNLIRVRASNITFIPTREGWMYVSAIMDIRTRKFIGLSIKNRLTQELTTDALMQAVKRKKPVKGLIHHSALGYKSPEQYDMQLNTT